MMQTFPTFTKVFILAVLYLFLNMGSVNAHPEHTDWELAELSDYLIALQVLKHEVPEADTLFHRWMELREASWKIRELTDGQDLSIDNPKVEEQIDNADRLKKTLLKDCRIFFKNQTRILPTIRIHLGETLDIKWDQQAVATPVGSRSVIILEVKSDLEHLSNLFLSGEPDDQVLFWSKPIQISSEHPRYTFAYIAPNKAGPADAKISIKWQENIINEFTIRADGTLPARYDWYNHVPAESMYNMEHGDSPQTQQETTFDKDIKTIRFRIQDPETGEPMPVRVEVRDEELNSYWTPLRGPSRTVNRKGFRWKTPLWKFQQGPYLYIGGDAELGVNPSGKRVSIYHGFEYEPVVMDVPENGIVETAPRRWIDMESRGWYSGQTHIHTTDVGLPVQYNRFWPLVTQAEDLGFSSILTLQGEMQTHAVYADEYPVGLLESHSTPDHLIIYGEEYRNNPYGHLALLGLDYLIMPLSSGALGELGGPDYPSNQFVLEEALSQGATTIGAHFGDYILKDNPITSSWPSLGFELPINVALGDLHLAEIYGNGNGSQQEVWYKLLNCGFDLPATSGPDWIMKDTPRVYVHLGQKPFTVNNWLEGLRNGHSFITKGPMLFFKVEGKLPGGQLHYADRPQKVRVQASALTHKGGQSVEIIVNGKVVAKGTNLDRFINLKESSWIAARTEGAHSNPVFVTLAGRPRVSKEEAKLFLKITDRLKQWVEEKGLFKNPEQKQSVLNVLRNGRNVYENIVDRAEYLDSQ